MTEERRSPLLALAVVLAAGLLVWLGSWLASNGDEAASSIPAGTRQATPSPPVAQSPNPQDAAPDASRFTPPARARITPAEARRTPRDPAHQPAAEPSAPASTAAPIAHEPGDEVLHTPDGDGIRTAIRDAIPDIKSCYEAWLKANPDLAGKVVVDFVIDVDPEDPGAGLVKDLSVPESTVDHLMLEGCIGSVFEGLSFEAPEEPVEVSGYPLVFSSVGDANE